MRTSHNSCVHWNHRVLLQYNSDSVGVGCNPTLHFSIPWVMLMVLLRGQRCGYKDGRQHLWGRKVQLTNLFKILETRTSLFHKR